MTSFYTSRPQRTITKGMQYPSELAEGSPSSVLSQSKKIAKASRNSNASTPASNSERMGTKPRNVNETYSSEEREQIVASIRRYIISLEGNKLDMGDLDSFDYVGYLKNLDSDKLDMIIAHVIPEYKPELVLDKTKLSQLRKKIKGWFNTRQASGTLKGKRTAILENEIQELNRLKESSNYGQPSHLAKMEEMYAKAPIVFGSNMPYNHFSLNIKNEHDNMSNGYYKMQQYQSNKSVGEMLESNGLTTRSNSPLGSPIDAQGEVEGHTMMAHPYLTFETESDEYFWTKYQDDISAGFWNSAKKLYRLGEGLGI